MTLGIVFGGEAKIISKAMHFDFIILAAESYVCNYVIIIAYFFNTPLLQLIILQSHIFFLLSHFQHSIDYWLWADLIAPESQRLLKSVVRVKRQEEADIFYVPFFTTISYFLLEKQECKALYRVWEHLLRFNFQKKCLF